MTPEEYRYTINPCFGCDCYDPEYEGCIMPSIDRVYACDRETEEYKIKSFYYNNKDFKEYVDKYRSDRKISLEEALTHKIVNEVYLQYKEGSNG